MDEEDFWTEYYEQHDDWALWEYMIDQMMDKEEDTRWLNDTTPASAEPTL